MRNAEITLDDFKSQLQSFIRPPSLFRRLLNFMPGMGEINKSLQDEGVYGGVEQMIGIINSMTPEERRRPKLVGRGRRSRIARGAGVAAKEVRQPIKQFEQMAPLMQIMDDKPISIEERQRRIRDLIDGRGGDDNSSGGMHP